MSTNIVSVRINDCVEGSGLTIEDAMLTVLFPSKPFDISVQLRCIKCGECTQRHEDDGYGYKKATIMAMWHEQVTGLCKCLRDREEAIAADLADAKLEQEIRIVAGGQSRAKNILLEIRDRYGENAIKATLEVIKESPPENRWAALVDYIKEREEKDDWP